MSSEDSVGGGIIRCKCGSLAQLRVTKNGDNAGKEYWSCARNFNDKSRCNFFQWSDKSSSSPKLASNYSRFKPPSSTQSSSTTFSVNNNSLNSNTTSSSFASSSSGIGSSSSSSNNTNNTNNDLGAPLCSKHQVACVQKKVSKDGPNKGKLFWSCPLDFKCHFEWCKEGTKVADYVLNPENQYRPMYSSVHVSKNSQGGMPYLVNFQLVGSNILQQAMKQQKDRHETLILNNANHDCVLVTFPRPGFVTDKLIRSLNELFASQGKITKLDELEYLFPLDEHEILRKYFLDVKIDGTSIQVLDFPDIVKLIINNYPQIDITKTEELCAELDLANKFPKQVWTKLRPFQKQGISFGVKRGGKVLLGDEMGVGKTLQGLSTMYYFKQDWPLLIICPSSLKHNWGKEIEDWFICDERGHNDITMDKIKIISHGKQTPDNYINIVSYTMAANMLENSSPSGDGPSEGGAILNGVKFNCIICDESHYLKNSSTKRSSHIVPFLKQAKRLVMITGTPALSRPVEVFPQLNLLLDNEFTFTKSAFTHRYCDAKETQFGIDDKGSSNVLELNYLLSRTVMIRRRKDTVLSELPSKQRQRVLLSVKPSDLKQLEYSAEKMKRAIDKMKTAITSEEHNQSNFDKNSEIFKMYTMTGKAKLPAVKEYIQDMIETTGDLKFLVFAYHKEVLDGIEECVAKELAAFYKLKGKKEKELQKKMRGDYYIRIDGSTDSNRRQNLVNTFKTNGHCRVAILSIKAAGVGYTMTPCSTVLFAELYWTPSDLRQAEDRVHRIGQKNAVNIKYLLGKDTFDEYLWPLLQKKLDVVGKSVDGQSHVDQNVDQVVFDRTNTYSDNEDDEILDEYGEYSRNYLDEDEEEEYYEELERVEKKSPKIRGSKSKESTQSSQSNVSTRGAGPGGPGADDDDSSGSSSTQIAKVIPPEKSTATDFLKSFLYKKDGKLPPNIVLMRDDVDPKTAAAKKEYVYNKSFRDSSEIKANKRPLSTVLEDDDDVLNNEEMNEDIAFGTPKKKTATTNLSNKTSPFFSKTRSLLPNTSGLKQKLPSRGTSSIISSSSSSHSSEITKTNHSDDDFMMLDGDNDDVVEEKKTSFLNLSNAFKRQAEIPTTSKLLPASTITPSSKFLQQQPSSSSTITKFVLPQQTPPPKLLATSTQVPSIPSPVGNMGKSSISSTSGSSIPIRTSPSNSISSNTSPSSSVSHHNSPQNSSAPKSDLATVLAKFSFTGNQVSLSPFSRKSTLSTVGTPTRPTQCITSIVGTPPSSSSGSSSTITSPFISNTNASSSTNNNTNATTTTPKFVPPVFKSPFTNTSSTNIQQTFSPPPNKQALLEQPHLKKLKIDHPVVIQTLQPKTNTTKIGSIGSSNNGSNSGNNRNENSENQEIEDTELFEIDDILPDMI